MRPHSFRIPNGVAMQNGFACTHCGPRRQLFRSPATAGRHVQHCIHNPQNRACATCAHDGSDCDQGARPAGVQVVRNCVEWAGR